MMKNGDNILRVRAKRNVISRSPEMMNGDNILRVRAKRRAGVLDRNRGGACSLQPGPKRRRSKQAKTLSEDLIKLCILPRLPTEALLRFQCVSKSWHSFIIGSSDPYFIHLHLRSQSSILSSILVVEELKPGGEFHGDFIPRHPRSSGKPTLHFPNEMNSKFVLASCNGLLCLRHGFQDTRKQVYIGNPILGDWRLLPPHRHGHGDRDSNIFHGLAVDVEKSGVSYKLVLPERLRNDAGNKYLSDEAIFNVLSSSSRSGQWEWEVSKYKLDVSKCWPPHGRATYANGVLYWICNYQILWFDVKDGRCGLFPIPPDTSDHDRYTHREAVGVWNGELTYTKVAGHGRMEIWSRADQFSPWTKNYDIILPILDISPMPFEGGNVVFFHVHGRYIFNYDMRYLFSYDMETGVVESEVYKGHYCHDFLPYKHCLTPLPSL